MLSRQDSIHDSIDLDFPSSQAISPSQSSLEDKAAFDLSNRYTRGSSLEPVRYSFRYHKFTLDSHYKGHIGTLETVLYIEVVLNSDVIQWNFSIKDTLGPWKYRGCSQTRQVTFCVKIFSFSFTRGFHSTYIQLSVLR